MRLRPSSTAVAGALLALGATVMSGCTSQDEPAPKPSASATSSKDACVAVRAGIDAFNDGDYDETVERFREAVPLAEAQAKSSDTQVADDLLEAVEYYAELAPDDYPESARSSPQFAKYKAITLGQCVPAEQPEETDPPVET